MDADTKVKIYHRTKLLCSLAHTLIFIAYAGLWCWIGPAVAESLSAWLTGRWVLLVGFALLFMGGYELLTLPLGFYSSYRLEHRYDLSNETIKGWIETQLKTWAVGAVIGGIILLGLYGLLWYGGELWYAWAWAAWLGLVVVLAQLFPIVLLPIFYPSTPITDEALIGRLHRLAEGTGITLTGVFQLGLSKDTKKANAMLTGLGHTRRVLLSDTLLEAFSPDEVDIVFAHELGHHVRKHIWKGLAMTTVTSAATIGLVAWCLGPHAGPAASPIQAVAALPLVMLAATVLQVVLQPVGNALQRHFEVQADTDALTRTNNPAAYRSAFEKLGEMNLADPSPHPLIEWYFYDHPALAKRLALADGYAPAATTG